MKRIYDHLWLCALLVLFQRGVSFARSSGGQDKQGCCPRESGRERSYVAVKLVWALNYALLSLGEDYLSAWPARLAGEAGHRPCHILTLGGQPGVGSVKTHSTTA